MAKLIIIVLLLLLNIDWKVEGDSISSRLNNCGVNQGCWLMPPGCEQSSGPVCTGVVAWVVDAQGIMFTLITYVKDLYEMSPKNRAVYGAVGFSLDSFMGEDLVFVCAMNDSGKSQVYLAWNDQREPGRLYEATSAMISEAQLSIVDNRMNCQFKWSFSGLQKVPQKFRQKVHNLSDPNAEFYLLFARGNANPNTLDLNPHSLVDGLLFPFVSSETVSFCESGCGQAAGVNWLTQMHQSHISQNFKQKAIIVNAAVFLTATFVLFPSAIMSARFNKDHLQRCCGIYLWFHVHWICNLLGFILVSVGVFGVYFLNNFKIFQCSASCNEKSFNRQMHAVFGTIAYSFMCAQVLAGLCRPKITSPSRPSFNLIHTFSGYIMWSLCCRACLHGTQMSRTGLPSYFGRYAEHLVWTGIYCALICFFICEWLVNRDCYFARNPDSVEELTAGTQSDTKLVDDTEEHETASCAPVVVICFNALTGMCIAISIVIMLLRTSKIMGFDI